MSSSPFYTGFGAAAGFGSQGFGAAANKGSGFASAASQGGGFGAFAASGGGKTREQDCLAGFPLLFAPSGRVYLLSLHTISVLEFQVVGLVE